MIILWLFNDGSKYKANKKINIQLLQTQAIIFLRDYQLYINLRSKEVFTTNFNADQ